MTVSLLSTLLLVATLSLLCHTQGSDVLMFGGGAGAATSSASTAGTGTVSHARKGGEFKLSSAIPIDGSHLTSSNYNADLRQQQQQQQHSNKRFAFDWHERMLRETMVLIRSGDPASLLSAKEMLAKGMDIFPLRGDSYQLTGVIHIQENEPGKAIAYLRKALDLEGWRNIRVICNLMEAYRRLGDLTLALEVGVRGLSLDPLDLDLLAAVALVERDRKAYPDCVQYLLRALEVDPADPDQKWMWNMAIKLNLDHIDKRSGEYLAKRALEFFPNDAEILYFAGTSLHLQDKLEEAEGFYKRSLAIDPNYKDSLSNLAALYQGWGRINEAVTLCKYMLPLMEKDSMFLNNYGALMGILGRDEEEGYFLKKALTVDPHIREAHVNLASHYQDNMDLPSAINHLEIASRTSPKKFEMMIRTAIMLTVVAPSWEQMVKERLTVEESLLLIINASKEVVQSSSIDTIMEKTPFYLVYHCMNDRYLLELLAMTYRIVLSDVEFILPRLAAMKPVESVTLTDMRDITQTSTNSGSGSSGSRRVRIGFMSKFFGIFEPHGLLLDGLMQILPRDRFEVYVLPVARSDGKPLMNSVKNSADVIVEVSLSVYHTRRQISALELDVLVFADILSEPMNHFAAFSRLAKIQIAFWGNPVTSASRHIDYFISGDGLEHPYRTRIPVYDEPYVEQVVLLDGQGIWYYPPSDPLVEMSLSMNINKTEYDDRNDKVNRAFYGLKDDWFIFLCPQSTFKIHPLFDKVFAAILNGLPENVHIVALGGRRSKWTNAYVKRINNSLGPVQTRFHIIERVSSELFIDVCKLGDVILHPFPFDGSRTSADSLYAGIPFVTLPSQYLRGRMGVAFLRTMDLPELAARNFSEYLIICFNLYHNRTFLADVRLKIQERTHLIWEDMEYAFSWTQFVSRASGYPLLSIDELIINSGRDLAKETALINLRAANRRSFDLRWGRELWLLDADGSAPLETFFDQQSAMPRIFNDWKADLPTKSTSLTGLTSSSSSSSLPSLPSSFSGHLSSFGSKFALLRIEQFWHSNRAIARSSLYKFLNKSKPDDHFLFDFSNFDSSSVVGNSSIDSSDTANSININYYNTTLNALIISFHILIRDGNYDEAYHLVTSDPSTLESLSRAPLFLVELGALQLVRDKHADGYRYCKRGLAKLPGSKLAHTCVGVTGTYLKIEEGTLESLYTAWRLQLVADQALAQANRSEGNNNSNNSNYSSSICCGNISEDSSSGLSRRDGGLALIPIFNTSAESLAYNVLSALKAFERYQECVDILVAYADVGEFTNKEVFLVALFSLVDWSNDKEFVLDQYERIVRERLVFTSASERSLFLLIREFRSRTKHLINGAFECLQGSVPSDFASSALVDVSSLIMIEHPFIPPEVPASIPETEIELVAAQYLNSIEKVILITQVYISENEDKNVDLLAALSRNIENPYIEEVVLLSEHSYRFNGLLRPEKIKQFILGRRLTFQDAFNYANTYHPGRLVIIANADIYFDSSLARICKPFSKKFDMTNQVFALGKWVDVKSSLAENEVGINEAGQVDRRAGAVTQSGSSMGATTFLRTDSQDAWVLRSPIRDDVVANTNFFLGAVRADNVLAALLGLLNYNVTNPMFGLHAFETDTMKRVPFYGNKDYVHGPMADVLISDRMEF